MKESTLYAPLRDHLVAQGYEVKSEIGHCDVVAVRDDEAPVVVELKSTLSLELLLQATERFRLTDKVYIAFPATASAWRRHWRRVRALCRRLGLGLITLDGPSLAVNVRLDPLPYRPRVQPARRERLLLEFARRVGDPNTAGVTRVPLETAYRQDALRCLAALDAEQPTSLRAVRERSGVGAAGRILQRNHYGWFERAARGVYLPSPRGMEARQTYADSIRALGAGGRSRPAG